MIQFGKSSRLTKEEALVIADHAKKVAEWIFYKCNLDTFDEKWYGSTYEELVYRLKIVMKENP